MSSLLRSYASLIADWPVVVLGMCTAFIVVCALVGVLVPELPDFSDPLLVRKTATRTSFAQNDLRKFSILMHVTLCNYDPF